MIQADRDITWGEFKEAVSQEVSDDTEISWIGMSGYCHPKVQFYKSGAVIIANGTSRYTDDA